MLSEVNMKFLKNRQLGQSVRISRDEKESRVEELKKALCYIEKYFKKYNVCNIDKVCDSQWRAIGKKVTGDLKFIGWLKLKRRGIKYDRLVNN
jgi:hypothetical protein